MVLVYILLQIWSQKQLRIMGEYKYDVIFTDIDLSTGNGISLIKS